MTSPAPPPVELRTARWLHLALMLLGCGLFVVVGAVLIVLGLQHLPTRIHWLAAGLLSIVFFGGLFVTSFRDIARGRAVRLDGHGIAISRMGETLELGWDEIVDVGVVEIERTRMVGLRLADPAAAARRAPNAATGGNPGARRLISTVGSLVAGRLPRSAADMLAFRRSRYGYDVMLGWADRDRSASRLRELIERYRRA